MAEDLPTDGQPAQSSPTEEPSEDDHEWTKAIKNWPAVPAGLPNKDKVECYRNVILVMLFHAPLLVNELDKVHDAYGEGCACLACRFHDLFNQFWETKRPEEFKGALRRFWEDTVPRDEHMNGASWEWLHSQQDAQEYLASLLTRLIEDEFGRPSVFQLAEIHRWTFLYCQACGLVAERRMGRLPDSQLKYMIVTVMPRAEDTLKADGPTADKRSSGIISTREALIHGLMHNKTSGRCENCDAVGDLIEGSPLRSGPPLLFVRIYSVSRGNRFKLDPYATVSVYPEPDKDRAYVEYVYYELYGVVFHEAYDTASGHYHGGFLGPEGKWAHFNDEESRRCSLEQLQGMQTDTTKVSLLAYRRLGTVQAKVDAKAEEAEKEWKSQSDTNENANGDTEWNLVDCAENGDADWTTSENADGDADPEA